MESDKPRLRVPFSICCVTVGNFLNLTAPCFLIRKGGVTVVPAFPGCLGDYWNKPLKCLAWCLQGANAIYIWAAIRATIIIILLWWVSSYKKFSIAFFSLSFPLVSPFGRISLFSPLPFCSFYFVSFSLLAMACH